MAGVVSPQHVQGPQGTPALHPLSPPSISSPQQGDSTAGPSVLCPLCCPLFQPHSIQGPFTATSCSVAAPSPQVGWDRRVQPPGRGQWGGRSCGILQGHPVLVVEEDGDTQLGDPGVPEEGPWIHMAVGKKSCEITPVPKSGVGGTWGWVKDRGQQGPRDRLVTEWGSPHSPTSTRPPQPVTQGPPEPSHPRTHNAAIPTPLCPTTAFPPSHPAAAAFPRRSPPEPGRGGGHKARGTRGGGAAGSAAPVRLYSVSLLPYKTTPQALYSGTARGAGGSKNKQRGRGDRAAGGGWRGGTRRGAAPHPVRRHCPWGERWGAKCPSVAGDPGARPPLGAPRVAPPPRPGTSVWSEAAAWPVAVPVPGGGSPRRGGP